MKFNHLLGILGGVLFSGIALTWWSLLPDSPDLHSIAPSASRATASESKSASQDRNRLSEPQYQSQHPADETTPKPTVKVPNEGTLEHRCLQLAERDPRAAVILAINTRADETYPGLLESLVAQWATHDLQASHQWVLQQQSGEWRDGLMARIAFVGSQSDPVAAAQIVVQEMTPGQRQTEAAISVLHQWALRDLNAAAAWAHTFPEGPLRKRAMDEIEGIRKVRLTGGL
jgi:hypothetical protein